MHRIARAIALGFPYLVVQRGNNREKVLLNEEDKEKYLSLLKKYSGKWNSPILAYCLMNNHVHLLTRPSKKSLYPKGCRVYSPLLYAIHQQGNMRTGGGVLLSVDSLSVINDTNLLDKHREDHHVIKYFKIREIEELLAKKWFKDIKVEPILKSIFAEKLFKAGIMNSFRFPRVAGLVYIVLLYITERFNSRNNEGIFLLVKAYKA